MLNKVIHFSVKNKLIIGLFTFLLVLWGGYSLSKLPIDAVPDITNNQVQIITSSPSLAAVEVERLITFPIEITMATIPKIEEIRSFSRFGLSVVTVVFKEGVDIYWARQQVSERLTEVQAKIPNGIGEPGMAPITTGLGEIYQYVVGTKLGYEDKYNARDLRTIQDWIVKRQLLGTPGVADVSSFGGFLKQFEIAINPDRLRSMNITISDIFNALKVNNENTGGAYIEKQQNAYFIRTEGLVENLDDIRSILVKTNPSGIPIFIKDVATVQLGNAVRYGATTRNGEGEVVSSIVMMLKGENSAEVIKNVKQKIEEIKKSLPEGVTIEPFLDRTKLVNSAIGTVTKNLTEGALIVIFVLLLLLGNARAGLIVASVIPLALIFAFGMMNLFGVSGNLMSLGAVDFGLIVDGAVIIVEATMHHLGKLKLGRRLTQSEMDEEVYQSASKIRNSAAFGEIIILIVYLPILALVGTEGKMFRPMAQTVSFAILGAFILSLTYVPMISALFLNKKISTKRSVADRIMDFLHSLYQPTIKWAMHHRLPIVSGTIGLFIAAILVFSSLGGEFIPTLEEGDFAVETRVITGSNLQTTIEATTAAEKILLAQFPEVIQVVSKIGSGEIPTDPMPIEAADLMIILKDKAEWENATNREDLATKMAEALEVIPGVTFGFQQPIQMRFNELMTGVRQDVAVKIYGEDLDELSNYANQIGQIAENVTGAVDVYTEEVTGVPQIVIRYKRNELARYGLNVSEVNHTVQAAFAGASAGLVYQNERRFDLVVRMEKANRGNLKDVQNLYIARADGHQIPLSQIAEVVIEEGPYQIQRDNTRRRILVAFNVRNRDVESVVKELQNKIESSVVLAPGYTVSYGGQFENLVEARKRLGVAVPMALLLIFILLYFTFNSIKQGILIFTAIPLSAIGGIFALWIRDMPFSISAGVGFIALFGVAVLNGIVLIGEFNTLKKEGVLDIFDRVYQGTKTRLRPVILTASVASLGFLPMAISNSSGAEVQKPLATVVIGGLLTATLLTLIILPILYYYFEKGIKLKRAAPLALFIGFTCLVSTNLHAQVSAHTYTSLQEAINKALLSNPNLKAAELNVQQQKALQGSSWNIPKTDVSLTHGQYNSIYSNDNQFNVSQKFSFPTVYINQHQAAKARYEASSYKKAETINQLTQQVKSVWYTLWLAKNKQTLLKEQDSIYQKFVKAAELRYKTGETNLLEKATATAQFAQIQIMRKQNEADIAIFKNRLQVLLNDTSAFEINMGALTPREIGNFSEATNIEGNPTLSHFKSQIKVAEQEKEVEQAKLLPDITLGYFNQSLNGPNQDLTGNPVIFTPADRFTGFQVGVSIPIFGAAGQASVIKAESLKKQESEMLFTATKNELQGLLNSLLQQFEKDKSNLTYYKENALPQADLILTQAQKGFDAGAIGYVEYTQGLTQALSIKLNYLQIINEYNQTIIQIEFLLGI